MATWTREYSEPPDSNEVFWTDQPIIGYRGWKWDTDAKRLRGQFDTWDSPKITAVHRGDPDRHKAPDWNCLCGINTYKTVDYEKMRRWPIVGKVELTGDVIEFERGYRGEVGEIIHLAIWEGYPELIGVTVADIRNVYPVNVSLEYKLTGKGSWWEREKDK